MTHDIPLERRTLHGHFSRDLAPVATIESGDTVAFSCLDSAWHVAPGETFEPRDEELDAGHALVGPIEVRGARAGQTLALRIDEVRVGSFGATLAGGWSTPLNDRLDMSQGEKLTLHWSLEAGTTLFLPIPVDGALFSAGDGHARQGDGEVSQTAIECPLDRLELTLSVEDRPELRTPIAWTPGAWLTFGFDEDLDEAAAVAVDGMLELMRRELELERVDALALASVVVDLRVTQLVNGVRGVHAVLRHDAIRM